MFFSFWITASTSSIRARRLPRRCCATRRGFASSQQLAEALGVPGEKVWRIRHWLYRPPPEPQLNAENLRALDAVQLFVERAAAVAPFVLTRETPGPSWSITVRGSTNCACNRARGRQGEDARRWSKSGTGCMIVSDCSPVAATPSSRDSERWKRRSTGATNCSRMPSGVCSHGCPCSPVVGRSRPPSRFVPVTASRRATCSMPVALGRQVLGGCGPHAATEPGYRFLETSANTDASVCSGPARRRRLASGTSIIFSNSPVVPSLKLIRRNQVVWLNRADQDHDNLRTAIEWGAAESTRSADALHLAKCLWWFWTKRGYFMEGRQRLEAALAAVADAPPGLYTRAHVGLMHLALFAGDLEGTEEMVARTVVAAQEAGDPWADRSRSQSPQSSMRSRQL